MPRQSAAAAAAAHRLAREVTRLIENLADAEEDRYTDVQRTRAALAAYYHTQRPTITTRKAIAP